MSAKRPRLVGFCAVALLGIYGLAIASIGLWRDVQTNAQPSADQLAGSICAFAAWVVAAWLASTVLLTIVAAAPGVIGRFSRRWAMRLAPTAIRTALGLMLGITPVVLAPTIAAPASAAEITEDEPIIGRPLGSAVASSGTEHAAHDPASTEVAALAMGKGDRVTVRVGDSLWSIAEDHLARNASVRDIAAEWPRWFAANRDEIGPDPNMLQIGTTLTAPPR